MTDISYQLYSSREFPPLTETLKMLSEMGYTQAEGYSALMGDVGAIKSALSEAGMTMPSAHIGVDMLENDISSAFKIAETLGIKAIYCPFLMPDDRPDTKEGWQSFGERLQKIEKQVRAEGLDFGWHNHEFEFIPMADGSIPMEEIFAAAPNLSWEADLAWVARGGADPLEWIKRYGSRIISVHIKDIAPEGECADEDGWADVGYGVMDWGALLQAVGKTPAKTLVMEHDKPSDHRRFASRSIETVKKILGA